jgi:putative addiction module component (TIGR02574 family)
MRRDDKRPFDDLSVPEKILHVQDLWDRIAQAPDELEVTEAQRVELERRLRAHEDNPGSYTTWEELRQRLEEQSL